MKSSTLALSILAGVGFLAVASCIGVVSLGVYTVIEESKSNPVFSGQGFNPGPPSVDFTPQVPDLELQQEDYAEARQTFRTKLLRSAPSPQPITIAARIPACAQKITYVSGALQLTAYVDDPPADGQKRPGVLFLHGGFAFGGDDLEMPQPYRDAGFIVLEPLLRGENGLPGVFTNCYDELDDVFAAADALAALPYVDSQRLFVAGHHAGGTLALLAAMTSNRFRAAATFSATCNQRSSMAMWNPFDMSDVRELEMRSPMAYATSFKCPVRLYYGDIEKHLGAQTETTAERAQEANLDVDTGSSPGNHMTHVPASMRRSVEFFKRFLREAQPKTEVESADPQAVE